MAKAKLLAFAGSARKGSLNKKLVNVAATAARAIGAEVTVVDFRDLAMPLFDEDLETSSGIPDNVMKFKELMEAHHGFLISCPEYNSSITPLLKNAFDWASRAVRGKKAHYCTSGKIVGLMSASPGNYGGIRGLAIVRSLLTNNQAIVMPNQVAVPNADAAFSNDGGLKDKAIQKLIDQMVADVVNTVKKLNL